MPDEPLTPPPSRAEAGVGLDLAIVVMLSVVFLPLFVVHFIAAALAK